MNKLIKAIKTVVLSLLGAVLLTTTVLGFVTHGTARKTGETLASPIGTAVGKFIGSIDGIKKAKEEVSKEDLTSSEPEKIIAKKMQSVGKLEVLIADITIDSVDSVGDSYRCLTVKEGKIIFTVDLALADVLTVGRKLIITVPTPEFELIVNESNKTVEAEKSNPSIFTDSQDGMIAYIEFEKIDTNKVKTELSEYNSLYEKAQDSAKKQIEQLAEYACADQFEFSIEFEGEG